jgi:hypothetical protein
VKLSNEELQAKVSKPSKEVGESLLQIWMAVSKPQEPNYLDKQKK